MTGSYAQGVRMLRHKLEALFIFSIAFTAATAHAQTYTSLTTSGTFSSIASTGTSISLTDVDDGAGSFTAPFTFQWFAGSVFSGDTIYVNTNGMLAFGAESTDRVNTSIPTAGAPESFIAPFWDDLYFVTGGVYYSTSGSSGSYVLTVEWSNVAHYNAQTDNISFQVKIYQATGNVELWYGSRTGGSTWTGSIGLENGTGSTGVQESCTPSCTLTSVSSGTVIRYTPTGMPPPPPLAADFTITYLDTIPNPVTAGQAYSIQWEVDNTGQGASTASGIGLYAGLSPTVTASDYQLDYQTFSAISAGSYTYAYFNATIPAQLSGTYYVAAIADPLGTCIESNESNNTYNAGAVTVQPGSGGTIYVTTEGLPSGTAGQFYSQTLSQTGGFSPTWDLYSGSLPPGLSLGTGGSISGTPSTQGSYSFTVRASESGYTPGTANLSIQINAGGGPVISTMSIPSAAIGVPYMTTISVTGGSAPYTFQLSSETTPPWLSIDSSTGLMHGTPDAANIYSLNVYVTDASFQSTSTVLQLTVTQPSQLSLNPSLPAAQTGNAYNASLVIGGIPPFTVQITQGTLPSGITLDNASATLSGTPVRTGMFTFTVDITDSNSPQGHVMGQMNIQVTVPTGLQITIGEELPVYTNGDAHVPLTAMGGSTPYTWSLVQGALQAGLTLDPMGFIYGRVMRASTATVTFSVQDSVGATDSAVVYVKAQPFRPPVNRGGGNGRDSGCSCETSANELSAGGTGVLMLLFAMALLFRRRA